MEFHLGLQLYSLVIQTPISCKCSIPESIPMPWSKCRIYVNQWGLIAQSKPTEHYWYTNTNTGDQPHYNNILTKQMHYFKSELCIYSQSIQEKTLWKKHTSLQLSTSFWRHYHARNLSTTIIIKFFLGISNILIKSIWANLHTFACVSNHLLGITSSCDFSTGLSHWGPSLHFNTAPNPSLY